MTRATQHLLIAALLAASGAVATAQTPLQPAAGESVERSAPAERRGRFDPAQMQQRMAQRHSQRMAELKAQLRITPAQEGAWNQFSATMQPPAIGQRPAQNRADWARLTTPQRIDQMQQRASERQQQMAQRGDAIKAFYAQLSAEQQKTFDERSRRDGRRGDHRHHGGGWGGGMGMGYGPR